MTTACMLVGYPWSTTREMYAVSLEKGVVKWRLVTIDVCCNRYTKMLSSLGIGWLSFQYHKHIQGEEIGWRHLRRTYDFLHRVVNWFVPTFRRNYLLPTSGQFPSRHQNKPIIIQV